MSAQRMPAAFIGHGSPMNTLERNRYTESWRAFGASVPRPRAILMVSAHWTINATAVTAMARPKTIHDFYGFPQALFDVQYPAPGLPQLAEEVADVAQPEYVGADHDSWGLDHGTWSVLVHAFPDADIPVVQLSLNILKPPEWHVALGAKLAALRDRGVLVMGSGNVVHNLRVMRRTNGAGAYPWAVQFNEAVRGFLSRNAHGPLVDYHLLGEPAALSVPTPEHYLPMLYIAGARRVDDTFSVTTDGIDLASVGMLSFAYRTTEARS